MSSLNEIIDSLPKTELPSDIEEQGVKVMEIPARTFGTRKIFVNLKPEHIEFKQGQRVLPAEFVGVPDQGPVYYNKTYPPGTKHYSDGGHQCITEMGGYRTFHLDALMIHPNEMKKSQRVTIDGLKRRGRPSNPNKVQKDSDAPKGKRGRKPLDPEEKLKREMEKAAKLEANPERKRGRKALSDEERAKRLATNPPKDPNAPKGKRGRPSLPEHLKKSKPYVPNGGKRGRPKKQVQ